MSSITDIFSAAQNIVKALNQLGSTYQLQNGTLVSNGIAADTLVKTGQGRVARVSVTTAGSTAGVIYDAAQTGITTYPVAAIPAAIAIIDVNIPVNSGIVVTPGTGQVITVSYS